MASVYNNVFEQAARVAGREPIMDKTARRILKAAQASARASKLTGEYLEALHIEEAGRGKDRLIVADAPGAIAREFGWLPVTHVKGSRRVRSGGKRVPAMQIMQKAYWSVPRG